MTRDTDLAALISTRICHDLVNPLGAIANGMEMLRMVNSANGPEMDLIDLSVRSATARIQVFRLAFGAGDGEQGVSATRLRTVLEALAADNDDIARLVEQHR